MSCRKVGLLLSCALLAATPCAHAAHPLITEDTGTQGLGKFQVELTTEHAYDHDDGEMRATSTAFALAAGLQDNLDLMLTAPHLRYSVKAADETSDGKGWMDMAIDLKWRFFERDAVSFAFKPGATIPTGNSDQELGNGKSTFSGYLVATYAPPPWAFHLHTGYIHNRNVLGQRQDLRHLSFAATFDASDRLKLVADIGVDTNTDTNDTSDPAFLIAGLVYSLYPTLDIDIGYKSALSASHVDRAYLAGLALRF